MSKLDNPKKVNKIVGLFLSLSPNDQKAFMIKTFQKLPNKDLTIET